MVKKIRITASMTAGELIRNLKIYFTTQQKILIQI